MDEPFKVNKVKALAKATTEQAFEEGRAILERLAKVWPAVADALYTLLVMKGLVLKYKQEQLNQFTEYMMAHPDVFTSEVLESKEFQDGLVVFVDTYFKLRSEEKLKHAEKIFYDFGKSDEKPVYPLERYDDTLEKISESGLRFLGFIHSEVPAVKKRYANKKIHQNGNQRDTERGYEFYYELYTKKSLWFFINEYISEKAIEKGKANPDAYATEEEKERTRLRELFLESISELEQLGLARSFSEGGIGWDNNSTTSYSLTTYGHKFISVIKPEVV